MCGTANVVCNVSFFAQMLAPTYSTRSGRAAPPSRKKPDTDDRDPALYPDGHAVSHVIQAVPPPIPPSSIGPSLIGGLRRCADADEAARTQTTAAVKSRLMNPLG